MTDVVNLNQFRKKRRRADKEKAATSNRAKFGRTKADKEATKLRETAGNRDLDGKKRETPEDG